MAKNETKAWRPRIPLAGEDPRDCEVVQYVERCSRRYGRSYLPRTVKAFLLILVDKEREGLSPDAVLKALSVEHQGKSGSVCPEETATPSLSPESFVEEPQVATVKTAPSHRKKRKKRKGKKNPTGGGSQGGPSKMFAPYGVMMTEEGEIVPFKKKSDKGPAERGGGT